MKNCPNCNYPLEAGHRFCPSCGTEIKAAETHSPESVNEEDVQELVVCDVCGEETGTEAGYCESCGAKLSGDEKRATAASRPAEPVVKTPPVEKEKKKEDSIKKNNVIPAKNKSRVQSGQKTSASSGRRDTKGSGKVNGPQKNLSPIQIGMLIAGILAAGIVVLWASGVFSTSPKAGGNDTVQQQQAPGISLENVQRINDLEAAVAKDSTNLNTVLELANLYNDSGLYEKAVSYYSMYIRANPGNADVQVDLGVCYFAMQKYDLAKKFMRRGLAINPRHQTANFNLGIVNFSSGNTDSAKVWWRKAIEIDPNSQVGKKAKELLESH